MQSVLSSEMLIIDDCLEDASVKTVVESYMRIDGRIRFKKL